MPLFRNLIIVLICAMMSGSVLAQSALKKAETYSQLNAHFLSIKYFQKHLKESTTDRKAMLKLAKCYLKADMPKQGRKWLLRAHQAKDFSAFFRNIAHNIPTNKALRLGGATLLKNRVKHLYVKTDVQYLAIQSPEEKTQMLLAVVSSVSKVL